MHQPRAVGACWLVEDDCCVAGLGRPSNPFTSAQAARLYARGGPFHHCRALARIRAIAGFDRLRRALDIGCGTGLSAKALAEVADEVVALDSAPKMLAFAPAAVGIEYVVGSAEHLPFAKEAFWRVDRLLQRALV
jgi:SAM-dependent methyltransferase